MIIARQKIYAQPPFYYTRELEENDWPDAIAVLSCSNRLVSFPRSCFIGGSAPRPACSRHTSVTAELSERGSPRSLRQSIASEWALLSGRTTATLHRALICYLRTGKVVGCLAVGVQLNRREMSEARVCRENVKPLPAALPRRQLPG